MQVLGRQVLGRQEKKVGKEGRKRRQEKKVGKGGTKEGRKKDEEVGEYSAKWVCRKENNDNESCIHKYRIVLYSIFD